MSRHCHRFEARCLKDIVDKYEENLGFEKSFISILANRTKKQVDEIRRYYKKDFNEDFDADILRKVFYLSTFIDKNYMGSDKNNKAMKWSYAFSVFINCCLSLMDCCVGWCWIESRLITINTHLPNYIVTTFTEKVVGF